MWRLMALVLLAASTGVQAEPAADFYKGKTLKMVVGYSPGGGYDIYGRLAAEFLGRHIPGNPSIIVVNMPGSGSLKAIDYLYQIAPQDGTYLGSVMQQMALTTVIDDKNKMNIERFSYVGRLTSNIDIAVALPQAKITSFQDLGDRQGGIDPVPERAQAISSTRIRSDRA
jgi:tripartite-type tricarboxylate transporter receptor subunit TctC